ncbi:MAG: RnfABCDGE type electron transport complex subunit B [Burkholderiales bacterium]|nr:RnfABCDGE type electron transport complex subunit B [Burkholderiales bacterium]
MTPTSALLSQRIDAVLPQTQCTRCGYSGCAPYARALAAGEADLDRCPPGGDAVVAALAELTGLAPKPVDPARGTQAPLLVAVIDEAACIGCTLCIEACPVDAIIGAQKRMHAILPSLCSGCEKCVAPCPTDCISMAPAGREWTLADAAAARLRHSARNARIVRRERISDRRHGVDSTTSARAQRQAAVAAALDRARARRGC